MSVGAVVTNGWTSRLLFLLMATCTTKSGAFVENDFLYACRVTLSAEESLGGLVIMSTRLL